MSFLESSIGAWHGRNSFRLMPDDDLAVAAASAVSASEASGWGWSLRYTWVHPQDGEQHGCLLLGSPTDDGAISAGWVDSWHQKDLRLLVGSYVEGRIHLEMTYDGWGWLISLHTGADHLRLVMSNVIPAGVKGPDAVAYVVMDAALDRSDEAATARTSPEREVFDLAPSPRESPAPVHVVEVIADLAVPSITTARDFPVDYLGLSIEEFNLGWVARFTSPHTGAHLQVVTQDATAAVTPQISVKVVDVDGAYAEAQRRGYNIVHPLCDEEWGVRRFFVRAPDGNVVNVVRHRH